MTIFKRIFCKHANANVLLNLNKVSSVHLHQNTITYKMSHEITGLNGLFLFTIGWINSPTNKEYATDFPNNEQAMIEFDSLFKHIKD